VRSNSPRSFSTCSLSWTALARGRGTEEIKRTRYLLQGLFFRSWPSWFRIPWIISLQYGTVSTSRKSARTWYALGLERAIEDEVGRTPPCTAGSAAQADVAAAHTTAVSQQAGTAAERRRTWELACSLPGRAAAAWSPVHQAHSMRDAAAAHSTLRQGQQPSGRQG
jgi:hypothetical protein